jgi:hypothetical protein
VNYLISPFRIKLRPHFYLSPFICKNTVLVKITATVVNYNNNLRERFDLFKGNMQNLLKYREV